nr:type II toxin-antitoxin system HipA family toxin [Neisseria lisongii]
MSVFRHLQNGEKVLVGELAENRQGIFFAYDADYCRQYPSLSPFKLKFNPELQLAPKEPHFSLHGVFADCLPDGWGMLLQDRFFESHGIDPMRVSPLDRLAFVGDTGIGALSFEPIIKNPLLEEVSFEQLGKNAQEIFDGQTEDVLIALIKAGSSGGARPKAQIFMPAGNHHLCRTQAQQGDEGWIVKFTSQNLPLKWEEGLCEAVYLTMAEQAKLQPVQWVLLNPQQPWLAVKRFDYLAENKGRIHTHSLCGLLDASHRMPSLDYSGLLKTTKILCQSREAGQLQFRRAMFNLFALNQDDHTKNWAFVQDELGNWQASQAYDITYSPLRHGEHSMAFKQYGKAPPLKVIQELAEIAGFSHWQEARVAIDEVVQAVANFAEIATALEIKSTTIKRIQQNLNQVFQDNRHLLAK